jgi:hypothetical protein
MNKHHPIHAQGEMKQPGIHAVIVFDTDALVKLAYSIPNNLLQKPERDTQNPTWFDHTLRPLGRNNFMVAITEQSTWMAAQILRNGKGVGDIFENSQRRPHPMMLRRAGRLRAALADQEIRIVQPGPYDRSPSASFINDIFNASVNPQLSNPQKAEIIIRRAREEQPIHATYAATHFIQSLEVKKAPIFYLSDSSRALKVMMQTCNRAGSPVHALSMTDFFGALADQNMFPLLGLEAQDAQQPVGSIKQMAELREEKVFFLDSEPYTSPANRAAFGATLMDLKGDLYAPLVRTNIGTGSLRIFKPAARL